MYELIQIKNIVFKNVQKFLEKIISGYSLHYYIFFFPCLRVQLFKLHVIFLQDDDFFPAKKIPRLYSNIIFNASNNILCLKKRQTTNTKYILQDCKLKINT